MSDKYRLEPGTPSAEDHRALRAVVGMRTASIGATRVGLEGTIFGVVIRQGETLVGMGRVVGDGGMFFQIVDIVVAPAHQGKGLGKRIMHALMGHLADAAPSGADVSLIADGEANRLYEQYGFRPVTPKSIGMARLLD